MTTKITLTLYLLFSVFLGHSQPDFLNTDPTWSPDGEKILFISKRDGNNELYVMNKDGSNQTRLTFTNQRESEPRWSPDGKEILFNSERTGVNQIFKMNADGSGQINLTKSSVEEYQGTWSPKGDRISFTSIRDRNAQVYLMNTDGSNQKPLLRTKTNVSSAIWSHKNKFIIVWSVDAMANKLEHLKVNLDDGTHEILFLNMKKPCYLEDWSSDDSKFIYKVSSIYSPTESSDEIYYADPDFTTNQRIQKNMQNIISAKLSPQDDRILIESNSTVYIQRIGDNSKIFRLAKNQNSPEWSPDGKSVVMVSSGNKMNIFTINTDGTNLTQLTK
jgi:Tol biopolymer transport system component